MALEEEVKKCREEIESFRERVKKVGARCDDETRKTLSTLEGKLDHFWGDVREATDKLNQGMREGLDRFVDGWRDVHNTMHGHLLLIEARGFLASARRLAVEEDFVAARNELASAIRDVKRAQDMMPSRSSHLKELEKEIEAVGAHIRSEAAEAKAEITKIVKHSDRLLKEIESAA